MRGIYWPRGGPQLGASRIFFFFFCLNIGEVTFVSFIKWAKVHNALFKKNGLLQFSYNDLENSDVIFKIIILK